MGGGKIDNCNKPPDAMCLKGLLELMGGKVKKKIDGKIHPACALCGWYTGYIEDEEIKKLRAKLNRLKDNSKA